MTDSEHLVGFACTSCKGGYLPEYVVVSHTLCVACIMSAAPTLPIATYATKLWVVHIHVYYILFMYYMYYTCILLKGFKILLFLLL